MPEGIAPITAPLVHEELAAYLKQKSPIRPLKQTLLDSSFLWGVTAAMATSLAIFSGLNEPVKNLVEADVNYARIVQGINGVLNTGIATGLILRGRYQTYQDMRDFQDGVDPQEIIARADFSKKGRLSRAFNRWMANTHNVAAVVSIVQCGIMMTSGVLSERWGEFASGLFLLGAYLARLRPERYESEEKPRQDSAPGWLAASFNRFAGTRAGAVVRKVIDQPPLILSSLIMFWRNIPAFANAVVEKDPYMTGCYTMSLLMLMFLANSTKDAIGRYNGSILSSANPKNGKIAEALLEGRLLKQLQPKAV